MTSDGERFARAAERFLGTPFRLNGRDPVAGLDCIGLVDASLRAIGRTPVSPAGYRLRNKSADPWLQHAEQSGFRPASGARTVGDLLLISPGPGQHHLVIVENDTKVIHAHAGLRRVVRHSIAFPARPLAHWRLAPRIEGTS